ncbi:MAG TPA: hypothetical protein EYG72_01320 [Candidatus Pacebacteria bacterium]|nr:hypothetical protein [Candidatus Paceibacterota bacterium]
MKTEPKTAKIENNKITIIYKPIIKLLFFKYLTSRELTAKNTPREIPKEINCFQNSELPPSTE